MKRVLLGLLVLVGAGVSMLPVDRALGHAAVVRSEPAANAFVQQPPAAITIVFTEPVDDRASSIRLLDSRGLAIATAAPSEVSNNGLTLSLALPKLSPGIYNVLYRNVSRIDGHALQGSYPFTILKADGSLPDAVNTFEGLSNGNDPAPEPEGIAVRGLSLLGLAISAAGALLILLWGTAGMSLRQPLTRMIYIGVAVLAFATMLNLATIRDAYGAGTPLNDLILRTPSGGYWLTRLGAVMLIGVAATFTVEAPRRTAVAIVAVLGVYLWAYTATSHAAAGVGSAWARGFDFAHGMAAVLWIGAVIGVAVSARLARKDLHFARLMPRFGTLASALVFVLLGTGLLNALVEIDSSDRLTSTRYGVTLLVKLGLMLPLLLVAAYNARRGRRAVVSGKPGAVRGFVRSATAEVLLGLGVFFAAAFLTQTTASKSIPEAIKPQEFDQAMQVADLNVRLGVEPNIVGLNKYRVTVTDQSGRPVDAERVRLTFRYQEDQTVGPSTLSLNRVDPGVYLGQGFYLTLQGGWRIEVEVRRSNVDDASGFFPIRPAGTAASKVRDGGSWSNPAPGLSWNQLGGMLLLFVGLGFALSRGRLAELSRRLGWTANGMSMFGFGFGALLLFGVHVQEPLPGGLPVNPVAPDQNSISAGRALYQQNCLACHGQTGVPPKGLNLDPYPLDLTVHVPQHPDGQLYNFVALGITGTAMRAWTQGEGKLAPEQVWHLVNYMRTLGSVTQ